VRVAEYATYLISSLISVLLDLKPENVLICIDDVESIIQAELANVSTITSTSPPTKFVGVPPSKGRGGNQTPRSESIFITGSQPLPSPSSSFGSSSALDKWAFGMSKIDGDDGSSKPGSMGSGIHFKAGSHKEKEKKAGDVTELTAEGLSNVTLEPNGFGGKAAPHHTKPPGPSLLSQQAPPDPSTLPPADLPPPPPYPPQPRFTTDASASDTPLSASLMSVDSERVTETSSSSALDGMEKITVKIADLGNGELFFWGEVTTGFFF
jgi:serine/threonine-protein kinase SRPK3